MRSTSRWGLFPGVAALIAVIALGLATAGCGGSSASTSASPTPSSSGSSAAATWNEGDIAALQVDPALKPMLPAGMTEIRVAFGLAYPPYDTFDPPDSKNPAGLDAELAKSIGKKIGVPVSFNPMAFDSLILSLKGGGNDMIMAGMYDSLEREQQGLSFVDYGYEGSSVLVKKGNPDGVSNLDSLAGKTVTCEIGTTEHALLQKTNQQLKSAGKQGITILAMPNQPAALLAITSGRAVGDMTGHSPGEYIAKTANNGATFEVVSDPSAPKGYDPGTPGIAIMAKNTQLVNTVQKALQDLIDEGAYQKMMAKWGVIPVQSAEVNHPAN